MFGHLTLKGAGFIAACLFLGGSALSAESSPASSPSVSPPKAKTSTAPKVKRRQAHAKSKQDFWSQCQGLKKSMYKADLDDSVYPKEPVVQDMPSVKPASLPCKFQPDTKSTAGARAKCSF